MESSKKLALFILHKILVDLRNFGHSKNVELVTALADCAELIPELVVTLEGDLLLSKVRELLAPFDQKFGHLHRRYSELRLDPDDPVWSSESRN